MKESKIYSILATTLFVFLWGSAAIFTKLGIDNASPLVLLIFRFTTALFVLFFFCAFKKQFLPEKGKILESAIIGLVLIGGYSVCYFFSMSHGVAPGLIATIMGTQPIIALYITERPLYGYRLLGLIFALSGLILLVWQSLISSALPITGLIFALLALIFITAGTIYQKKIKQTPYRVLPLQYIISIILCVILLPVDNFYINFNIDLLSAILFLGIFISVFAQILLYSLLNRGNVVNITSLFYLVPIVTVLLDYLIFGNQLPNFGVISMILIIMGIIIVFYKPKRHDNMR